MAKKYCHACGLPGHLSVVRGIGYCDNCLEEFMIDVDRYEEAR